MGVVVTVETMKEIMNENSAEVFVLAHGCFDLVHIGHIRHLKAGKKYGTKLIVSVTDDEFVNKGQNRPAFTAQLRAEFLSQLNFVDFVVINHHATAVELLGKLKPNVFIKGQDYIQAPTLGFKRELEYCNQNHIKLKYTHELQSSSTYLLNKFPVKHIESV